MPGKPVQETGRPDGHPPLPLGRQVTPNRVHSEVLGGAEELREAGADAGGCLGGGQICGPGGGWEGPWDPHLLALLLAVSQEQLQAQKLNLRISCLETEKEALEIQASDDVVPGRAALPVVPAEATGLVQPDHPGWMHERAGLGAGGGDLVESWALGRAGRRGLTSEGCHVRMLSRSCCFRNFTC